MNELLGRWGLVALALGAAACGGGSGEVECSESSWKPSGTVTVRGVARNLDGSPHAGRPLKLARCFRRDLLLRPDPLELTATTDDEGRFAFVVPGGEASSCFRARLTEDGHAVALELGLHRSKVDVPELRPWAGALALEAAAGDVRLRWVDLDASHGHPADAAVVELEVPTSEAPFPLWRARGRFAGALPLPARLYEDVPRLEAGVTLHAPECGAGTTFQRTYTTPGISAELSGGALPASRGAPCTAEPARDPQRGCPFTEGRFAWGATSGYLSGPRPEHLTIDLGAPRPIRHVVIRGLSMPYAELDEEGKPHFDHQYQVEAGDDGAALTRIAGPFEVADSAASGCLREALTGKAHCFADLTLEAPVTARYFRLAVVQNTPKDHNGQGNPATIGSLSQLSLFE